MQIFSISILTLDASNFTVQDPVREKKPTSNYYDLTFISGGGEDGCHADDCISKLYPIIQ